MNNGTVKWFNTKRGYGFIAVDGGNDIFVHYSEIQAEGFKRLKEGDKVTFDIVKDDNGREKAVNVSVAA